MSPKRNRPRTLRSYEEDAKRLKVMHRRDQGLHPIPVNRIIGSAGKPDQIGVDFQPTIPGWAQKRFQGVLNAAKKGVQFQPISVYKLHDLYYVVDGHNRVGAAKELGQLWIDAYVTEMLPKAEGHQNLLYYERKHFEEQTGLTRIILTELWRYPRLLEVIKAYGAYVSTQLSRDVELQESAKLWYRDEYQPIARRIRETNLIKALPGRTVGDIFFDVLQYQTEHSRERGRSMTLDEAFYSFAREHPMPLTTRVVRKGIAAVRAAPKTVVNRAERVEANLAEVDLAATTAGLAGVDSD